MSSLIKLLIIFFNKHLLHKLSYRHWHILLFFYNSIRTKSSYYIFNFDNPKTFNEKLLYLKNMSQPKLHTTVADKFLVRDYVSNIIGEDYLIPLIWHSTNIDDFTFQKLTRSCVVKLNTGSGNNFIVKDKASISDFNLIHKKLKKIMYNDFSLISRELHYKKIKPRILIEQLIDYPINDYKFFCLNGNPFMVQVDQDRFIDHKRDFFNLNWEKQDISLVYPNSKSIIEKPQRLNEMIEISKKLCKDFFFCRVDLYDSKNSIYFGEITLFPEGGVGPFKTYEMDLKMGKLIDLSLLSNED